MSLAKKFRKQIRDYRDLAINDMRHINSNLNMNDSKMPVLLELIYQTSLYKNSIKPKSNHNIVSVYEN